MAATTTTTRELAEPLLPREEGGDGSPGKEETHLPAYGLTNLLRFFSAADFALLLVGCAASAGFGAVPPLQARLLGNIFSGASGADAGALRHNINETVPKLIELGGAAFLTGYLQSMAMSALAERVLRRVKRQCLDALLRQDVAYYDRQSTGQITTLLFEQSQALLRGIAESTGMLVQLAAQMAISYVISFQTNAKVAGTLMGVVPVLALLVVTLVVTAVRTYKRLDQVNEEAGSFAEELLSAMQTVASFTGEARSVEKYDEVLGRAERLGFILVVIRSVGVSLLFFILFSTFGLSYWYGAKLVASEESDFGSVLTAVFTCIIASVSIGAAVPAIQALAQARTAAAALLGVIDREPDDVLPPEDAPAPEDALFESAIEFDNVCFSYPHRDTQVLNGASFTIEPGHTCALVGSSGCGKSTVISLLERFFEPTAGRITVGGRALDSLDVAWLRKRLALVSQEPVLFATSIVENIWLGLPGEPDMERVREAARMANASDFIDTFADGFDTDCGSSGLSLSGGQRQRIAIARALVRDPSVLLLDEATSALDNESERIVQAALDDLLSQRARTTVVIAHRLSTVRNADKIVVFGPNETSDKGGSHVVEQGTHETLMALDSGLYRSLVETGEGAGLAARPAAAPLSPPPLPPRGSFDDGPERHASGTGIGLISSAAAAMSPVGTESVDDDSAMRSLVRSASLLSTESASHALGSQQAHTGTSKTKEEDEDDEEAQYAVSKSRLWAESAGEMRSIVAGIVAAGVKGGVNPLTSIILSHALVNFVLLPKLGPEGVLPCHVDADCPDVQVCARFPIKDVYLCSDGFIDGHGPDDVRHAGLETLEFYVSAGAVIALSMFINAHSFGRASLSLTHRLKLRMFASYMRMDAAFFDQPKNQVGVLVSRLATDPILVQNVTSDYYGMLVENGFAVLIGLGIALNASWRFTLVIVVPCVLLVLSSFLRIQMYAQRKVATDALSGKVINQALANIRTVYSCTAEKAIAQYYAAFLDASLRAGIRNSNVTGLQNGMAQCLFQFVYAFSFWYGGYLIEQHVIDSQALSRVFFVLTLTAQGVGQSFARANDTSKAEVAISRIYFLLDDQRPIDYTVRGPPGAQPRLEGHIALRNVSFAYPTRAATPVLRGVDLNIRPGETVALVGSSGSGKSSILKLVERFYDPQVGAVLCDGHDLRDLDLVSLRNQIAVVDQQPVLFSASILENVAYGLPAEVYASLSPEALRERVVEACKSSNAHAFISDFPDQYDTPCGAKGKAMSGGQKQRIAIARALIKDPAILLLDEATSALDTVSEREVQQALDKLMTDTTRKRTIVVVAHRLSTVRGASRIVVLDRGTVVQEGTHDALMADTTGMYHTLYTSSEPI